MSDIADSVRADYGMRFRGKEEANEIADEIESLQARIAEQRWIPVSERLPPASGSYLLWTGKEMHMAVYRDDSYLFMDYWEEYEKLPGSHWMPLPQPPEE